LAISIVILNFNSLTINYLKTFKMLGMMALKNKIKGIILLLSQDIIQHYRLEQ
jgi:hypothetical protein